MDARTPLVGRFVVLPQCVPHANTVNAFAFRGTAARHAHAATTRTAEKQSTERERERRKKGKERSPSCAAKKEQGGRDKWRKRINRRRKKKQKTKTSERARKDGRRGKERGAEGRRKVERQTESEPPAKGASVFRACPASASPFMVYSRCLRRRDRFIAGKRKRRTEAALDRVADEETLSLE